jgi:hypothetical protein
MSLRRYGHGALAVGLASMILGAATVARADEPTKEQCISANEEAFALRKSYKLLAARHKLAICTAPVCPTVIRDDCAERLSELAKAIPSVVFTVKDAGGNDLSDVNVTMDSVVITQRLDGSAIEVDPGEHTFELSSASLPTVSKVLIISEGVRGRQEAVTLKVATAPEPPHARLVVLADPTSTVHIDGAAASIGRFDGRVAPGAHDVRVTRSGKLPFHAGVDLRDGDSRTIEATLEDEPHRSMLPWLIGGAVVVAVGAVIGGLVLFAPEDRTVTPAAGTLGSVKFTTFRR